MCFTKCLLLVFFNCISADPEYKTIKFNISRISNNPKCSNASFGGLQEGGFIKIQATGTDVLRPNGNCIFKKKDDPNQPLLPPIKFVHTDSRNQTLTSQILRLDKTMNRTMLKCSFEIGISGGNGQISQTILPAAECYLQNFEFAENPLALTGDGDGNSDITLPLAIAGGVLVFIIIIGQTIALLRCHFKSKAQLPNALEHLKSGSRSLDRNDRARYSTAPSLRSNKPPNRATADSDSHIYEFVGVNALYHGHEASAGFTEANIKNRPPLPLPGSPELEKLGVESPPRPPKATTNLMASMKTLNSNSSTLKKTDSKPQLAKTALPPKPDEESLPGSLKRPPKPLPKTGSIPKPSATDTKFLELKNALIKRNAGMVPSTASPSATLEKSAPNSGSPAHLGTLELKEAIKKRNGGIAPSTSSPSGTLEKRPPPPAPKKTFPNQPRQGAIKLPSNPAQHTEPAISPKPLAAVNPTVKPLVSTSLKSKIEATLKAPPGMPVKSQPVPPVSSPVSPGPPVTSPVMPSPMMKNRPLPVPNIATRPLPPIQSEEVPPAAPPAIRNRPLPVPNLASRPLPPIQQEDATPNSDEEWDYEPLEKYNIYNV